MAAHAATVQADAAREQVSDVACCAHDVRAAGNGPAGIWQREIAHTAQDV